MEEDIKEVLEVIKWVLNEGLMDNTTTVAAVADNRPKRNLPGERS